jgi:hypothetical protein
MWFKDGNAKTQLVTDHSQLSYSNSIMQHFGSFRQQRHPQHRQLGDVPPKPKSHRLHNWKQLNEFR